ncbi:hypothetical protein [Bradyrhizobium japonicum]|uniref:hypothetical protein n=1 Tax=Bradyrhizobium japonicum TaxID=375 RepID=UPI00058081DB|nr:hypothetical protein [Bradyrhizobium japonicum]MCD9110266.1 hypothetical protein [Bradyrhizobium japonicum]MCD9257445.1 hypothetical protein [Bradyrhizobium japonicum SEMIA 5079]MCD9823506.1 hypothetical protein [Bradyrhizobium japonicum]MCD9895107.1 hypothetical protein [Bradyrhizobium japonicum]MCD9910715.1 hypothetical protein [Bradyrhizobium japonicum]
MSDKRRKIGEFWTRFAVDAHGQHYWFAEHEPDVLHGPFKTLAESVENQRLTLLGPDSDADPTIERLQ